MSSRAVLPSGFAFAFAFGLALALGLALAPALARAQDRGEAHASLQTFVQPASGDWLVVVTPQVSGRVRATSWLRVDAGWTADVVTGATPHVYAPPDVVSAATRFSDTRHLLSAAGTASFAGHYELTAGYAYGFESDYRSHQVRGALRGDFADHNTVVQASYSHGFDSVCDLAQADRPVTLRQPLDQSRGCFSDLAQLTRERLDLDTAEVSLVQTLHRAWVGTLVGSYQHLGGFQSNPYRSVRLSGGLFQAQESHPRERHRGALTLRVRWAIERVRSTLGLDLRLYRDTWAVQSVTGELSYEQPFRQAQPAWRFGARARGYAQSGAFFYRDAGRDDSYDRAGPVGQLFTADQALAPLADLIVGVHAAWAGTRPAGRRYWKAFTDLDATLSFDYLKIFALTPEPPNAERTRGVASALTLGLAAAGRF